MAFSIPSQLRDLRRWVMRRGKLPVNVFGKSSGWNHPSFWMTFDDALDTWVDHPSKADGIGFIVARDPQLGDNQIIGIDTDCCRDPKTGWTSPWVSNFINELKSPTSISISGTGYRIFCQGKLPGGRNMVCFHGPDDLSDTAKANILAAKPDIEKKLRLGETVWNGIEVYEDGPAISP